MGLSIVSLTYHIHIFFPGLLLEANMAVGSFIQCFYLKIVLHPADYFKSLASFKHLTGSELRVQLPINNNEISTQVLQLMLRSNLFGKYIFSCDIFTQQVLRHLDEV